jgi:hypothetical protein
MLYQSVYFHVFMLLLIILSFQLPLTFLIRLVSWWWAPSDFFKISPVFLTNSFARNSILGRQFVFLLALQICQPTTLCFARFSSLSFFYCCPGLGVHCGIYKYSYNISNISYLNSPPPSFSLIPSHHSWNRFNMYHFSIFIHLYTVKCKRRKLRKWMWLMYSLFKNEYRSFKPVEATMKWGLR